jgi:membrane protease YdiL (CAAX protease family)
MASVGLPWLAEALTTAMRPGQRSGLAHLFVHHGLQAAMSFAAILLWSGLPSADFGLRRAKLSDVSSATRWALTVAALATALTYIPNVLSHTPPHPVHPADLGSLAGWTLFEGVYVGPTEEILFRSLLIGLLSRAGLPGFRLARVRLSGATVIAALLFGAAHYAGVTTAPWWQSAFQIGYAIVLGLIYGYWFERSRSLLAPAVAHNATDLFATWVAFGFAAVWR